MKLTERIWLLGAVVPFGCACLAVLLAGQVFRVNLERAVDERLLGQAAVESVSMFDGPTGRPHLHVQVSPLAERIGGFAPAAALYAADGTVEMRHPEELAAVWTEPHLSAEELEDELGLETVTQPHGGRVRRLTLAVQDPLGVRHALQLAESLAPVDAAVSEFHRTGVCMALVLGLTLLLLQSFFARGLRSRVTALTAHMAALRGGDLDAVPPRAVGDDEIADLGRVVASATDTLRHARAAQERLVAEAAHELRTPLALMRTSIDLALRRQRTAPELMATLDETRREVDRLAGLSTRLLDLASAGRGEWDRRTGDLAVVAAEAAEAARGAAEEKGILIEVDARGAVVTSFDTQGIRQAIDNLVANAVRFSPAGSTVRVEVRRHGQRVRVAVEDEGPGIPEADRDRIFEPFQRGAHGKGGAGLGLAITRAIARGHGGWAEAEAAARGARVVLELPVRRS